MTVRHLETHSFSLMAEQRQCCEILKLELQIWPCHIEIQTHRIWSQICHQTHSIAQCLSYRGFNPSKALLVGAQKREPLTFIIRCYKITSLKNLPLLHPWNLIKEIFSSLTQHGFSHWWDLSVSACIKCSDSNGYAFPVEIVSFC